MNKLLDPRAAKGTSKSGAEDLMGRLLQILKTINAEVPEAQIPNTSQSPSLQEKKADVNVESGWGFTPLDKATPDMLEDAVEGVLSQSHVPLHVLPLLLISS